MEKETLEDIIKFRRELHRSPELGYCEFSTSWKVCEYLDKYGISYETDIAKTGILVELKKGNGVFFARLHREITILRNFTGNLMTIVLKLNQ